MTTPTGLNYTNGFFDLLQPGGSADRMNKNLNLWRPGYGFGTTTINNRGYLKAPDNCGAFFWLQRGPAAAAIIEGPDGKEIVKSHCVAQNISTCDQILLPPGWSAEIRCGDTPVIFWTISIPGTVQDFVYRRGITSIDRCSNRSGWCNTGSDSPFGSVRRLVYSSVDEDFVAQPTNRSTTGLLLEQHTVLIRQSTSKVRAHYHPLNPAPDNSTAFQPQLELYLVGDPKERFYDVDATQSFARLHEDPMDADKYVDVEVRPGSAVFIPAGVGHGFHGGAPVAVVSLDRFRFGPKYEVPVGVAPKE